MTRSVAKTVLLQFLPVLLRPNGEYLTLLHGLLPGPRFSTDAREPHLANRCISGSDSLSSHPASHGRIASYAMPLRPVRPSAVALSVRPMSSHHSACRWRTASNAEWVIPLKDRVIPATLTPLLGRASVESVNDLACFLGYHVLAFFRPAVPHLSACIMVIP